MSEDQIPTADPALMPVCSILPFTKAEDVPPEFAIMDGRSVFYDEAPEFVTKMSQRWGERSEHMYFQKAVAFWEKHGGVVTPRWVKLPDIPSEEVTQLAFGVTYLPEDVKPVLAIKVWRSDD